MKINHIWNLSIASLVTLCQAKYYVFNVVSILGEGYSIGVKHNNDTVTPLRTSNFPLFNGAIEADNITQYKYVALDSENNVIEEESVERIYTQDNLNEVYNRNNKDVYIPSLPQPFKPMFPMGGNNFKPIPKNVIYNLYAKCDPEAYEDVTAFPFRPIETMKPNNRLVNCTLTIISPHSAFRSEGTLHIIGFGSRLYKKLSWNVKFNKKFLGRKSMKLRAMASDPALIREMLATSLYKSVGVPVQEGTFARLFINGDTYGLYYLTDSSSKKWISGYIHGNANSDIGISYKLYVSPPYYPDFHYYGDNYLNYTTYYFPDEYEDKDIDVSDESSVYTRVIEFIKLFDQWVNTPNQPLSQLKEFLNVEALIRMMVMDTLTLGLDNFMLRLSNASIYYNPERKNYLIIPYDFDSVLYGGRDDSMLNLQTVDKDCHTWAFQHEEIIDHYFARTILAHPEIRKRYDVVLAKTTKELFNGKVLSDYIDAVVDLIHEDVQWNFESLGRLAIPYNGFENHYTLENFEGNLNATAVIYKKGVIDNNTPYGLMQWINIRSQNCQEATEDAKTSKNENISDNYKMKVYKETTTDDISVISPAVLGSASSNASIILPSLKYIMFSVFILIKFLLL